MRSTISIHTKEATLFNHASKPAATTKQNKIVKIPFTYRWKYFLHLNPRRWKKTSATFLPSRFGRRFLFWHRKHTSLGLSCVCVCVLCAMVCRACFESSGRIQHLQGNRKNERTNVFVETLIYCYEV